MSKIYRGHRTPTECVVMVEHKDEGARSHSIYQLAPRLDLFNHSPDGFEWGYGGSGPAQLALALLADATCSDEVARKLHQPFKWASIAVLDRDDDWQMTDAEIREWIAQHDAERAKAAGWYGAEQVG